MKALLIALLPLAWPAAALAEAPKDAPPPATAAAAPAITYRDDKVTLDVQALAPETIVSTIAQQAGATVSGTVENATPVTAKWTGLPLKDALQQLLGTQNFTLTYSEKGELRTIALRGTQQEGQPAATDQEAVIDKNRSPTAEHDVFRSFDILAEIPIDGAVAKRLGRSSAPWDLVTNTAIGDKDPAVRRSAVKAGVKAFQADEALRQRVMAAANGMSDLQLAAFARAYMYFRAEEFVRNVRRESTQSDVRDRAATVLRELHNVPYEHANELPPNHREIELR